MPRHNWMLKSFWGHFHNCRYWFDERLSQFPMQFCLLEGVETIQLFARNTLCLCIVPKDPEETFLPKIETKLCQYLHGHISDNIKAPHLSIKDWAINFIHLALVMIVLKI